MHCTFHCVFSLCNFHVFIYQSHSKPNGVNQTIIRCFEKGWPSIVQTAAAENKEQDTLSNIIFIHLNPFKLQLFYWGLHWSRGSIDVEKLLEKPPMVFFFFWPCCRLGICNFTKNVFLSKVFAQICCYLSKFQDILRNFFPRETFRLWLLTVVRFSKYLFKQKLYIQGRTLKGLRKSMTFSISSGSLVAI